jgi:signal transduction histidine kinase
MPSDLIRLGEDLSERILSTEAELRKLFAQTPLASELETACQKLREDQRDLLQHERMQALAQMASGIAHDLNNSLTPIVGFSDFLLDAYPRLSGEAKKCLQGIRAAAADIARLTDQLRQFNRCRDACEPLQSVNLSNLVQEVLAKAQPRLPSIPREGFPVNLETEFDQNLPTIHEPEGELRQAIQHLVVNALEAMPKGGTLKIVTRLLRSGPQPGSEQEPAQVLLQVQDTGMGMDPSTQRHCVEPLFSTKRPSGRGFGLALVYSLVRRHRGSMEIESHFGRGTTVRLLFNPGECPSAQEQSVRPATGLMRGREVLA